MEGKINGKKGYEEEGDKGLMEGINEERSEEGSENVIIKRKEEYIGVMVDDMKYRGVREKYRMFKQREELRIQMSDDNEDKRLKKIDDEVGILREESSKRYLKSENELYNERMVKKQMQIKKNIEGYYDMRINKEGVRR